MSFINSTSNISEMNLPQQSQLIPLIRQIHEESLEGKQDINKSNGNSEIFNQEALQRFHQNNTSSKLYPLIQENSLQRTQNAKIQVDPDYRNLASNSNCNSLYFSKSKNQIPQSNQIICDENWNWIGKDLQLRQNQYKIDLPEKLSTQFDSHNSEEQANQMLFTPLGKSMPVRTFNFKLKSSKNKQFSKQFKQKKNIESNFNRLKENTIALELEIKLANEGQFTLQLFSELQNSFLKLVKIQQISRIFQLYLEKTPYSILHLIFCEISSYLSHLMFDPYGNYFCLKLFYYLDTKDRTIFLSNITPSFAILSTNKISTYPIQCILEQLHSLHEQKILFLSLKTSDYITLALDSYGTHVLAKILVLFDYSLIQPLSHFILENFLFLANNSNGLCIIKKEIMLEYKKDNFEQLKDNLKNNALVLVQSPYGNYALQIAIDNWELKDIESFIFEFIGKCSVLSIQKYSSNVIEKSIEKSDKFLNEFVKEMRDKEDTFCLLMKNYYGNYVIQSALNTGSFVNRSMIIQLIEANLNKLCDNKMINKWKNIILSYSTQNSNFNF